MSNLIDDQFAADFLGISVRRLRDMVRERKVPHIILPGEQLRFSREDLEGWIAAHRRDSAVPIAPTIIGDDALETLLRGEG